MEMEDERSIPFMYVLLTKIDDGTLMWQVYKNIIHTNRYLHANSHHFSTQKLGVINTLVIEICLPCIQGTTDKLVKIVKKVNIGVAFFPSNTIGRMVDSMKDLSNHKLYKGVYSIHCSCNKLYIGKTRKSIHVRLKEHCTTQRHDRIIRSALVEDVHNTSH
jgi:hypothetical protein